MTGNVVFLGFAVAHAQDFSIAASLAAIAAFLTGVPAGGRLGSTLGRHRGRLLAVAIYIQIALIGAALWLSIPPPTSMVSFPIMASSSSSRWRWACRMPRRAASVCPT